MKYHSLKDIDKKVPKPGSFKHFLRIQENGGRVVKGVNTTADVGVDAIKKQAAKFGNKVDKDGRPPTLSKKVKGSKTNVLFNLGLAESIDWVKLRNAKAVMPYALDSPEQRAKGLMPDAGSPNIYTSINLRTKLPAGYDAREFSKKEVSDQAWQKYMDGAWLGLKKVKKDQIKQAAKLAQIPIKEKTLDNTDESMLYYDKMAENLGELASTSKVFVDMDGVLADFFGEWKKLIGSDWRKVKDIEPALQKIRDTDNFFLNLPMLPQAKNLLGVIKKVKGSYSILSSPLPNDPNSEPHKREWIKKNLDFFPPENVIITQDKAKYAVNSDGTPNILIDDFGKNIASWEAAGGEGFKHKDHKFERTAKAIKQHMQEPVEERELTKGEEKKKEKYVKGMKKAKGDFKDRYGKDADAVMYATATKMAKEALLSGLYTTDQVLDLLENFADNDTVAIARERTKELYAVQKAIDDIYDDPNWNTRRDELKKLIRRESELEKEMGLVRPGNMWRYDHDSLGNKIKENFADGKKKGKSKPGRVKKSGASCSSSVTELRKKAKNASGERAKMYHWCANMKSGKKK